MRKAFETRVKKDVSEKGKTRKKMRARVREREIKIGRAGGKREGEGKKGDKKTRRKGEKRKE